MKFEKTPANRVKTLKSTLTSEGESCSGYLIATNPDENNNKTEIEDESFDSGIESITLFEKDDDETLYEEKEISAFREASRQLTRTEQEFEELKMLMESKLNEARNKLLQARIHHQHCLRSMTEEQIMEEVDK